MGNRTTSIDGLAVRSKRPRNGGARSVTQARNTTQLLAQMGYEGEDSNSQATETAVVRVQTNDFTDKAARNWADALEEMSQDGAMEVRRQKTAWEDEEPEEPVRRVEVQKRVDKVNRGEATKARKQAAKQADDEELFGGWGDEDDLLKVQRFLDEEPEPKRKHKKKKRHIGLIIALVIVLLLIGAGVAIYVWGDGLISRITSGQSGIWSTISAMVSDIIPFQTDEKGRTNVLVFGTEGYNMEGDVGYGTHDGAQLTDSIMVISFDQKTKDVALLSLPRDLKVSMACSAGKINEVFWCHNQDGESEAEGAEALVSQVERILGIDIQYYAHINWASLIYVIDRLGGITVTLDEDIYDPYYTGVVVTAGEPVTVNGEQALGLARARHGTVGGDFTRGNTQQKIVAATLQKVLENGLGFMEALDIMNNLGDNLRSTFSTDNIKAALNLVSGFSIDNIRQVPLVDYENEVFYMTTATINEISYVVPSAGTNNYREIQEYVERMFSSDPTVREGATIVVYNATGGYGVASAEKEALTEAGYEVVGVDNASEGSCVAQYCVYALDATKTGTAAKLAERYGVEVQTEVPEELEDTPADFAVVVGTLD